VYYETFYIFYTETNGLNNIYYIAEQKSLNKIIIFYKKINLDKYRIILYN
ncbi:unnamed protein product, partial [marine sediment metagenome]